MIDRATIDRIMDAANIVDVVSEFVTLRKSGANYKGLCPFHNERTPSFYVSPSKGYCKCFSCGKGGNSVGFIMEHEQMTYPEALRWLAHKYGIEIKEKELTEEEKQEQNERESMFIVNEWAAQYFENVLHNEPDGIAVGLQYFRSRGFRDDVISKFKLGFALNGRNTMSDAALAKGYKKEFLVKTGLSYEREQTGELFDRFAGRVIFPWIGISGKVVAFGGRVLDSRTKGVNQKYVNSPESEIFHKDHELYGIYQAKKAIAKEDRVYMVEGYMDVISMHQSGIENVVANSGTALSVHQIRTLHRFTQNIVLLYDGDAAGIHAALRGTDMLLAEGMNVKVLRFPDDEDPDSFARKHTAADFRQFVEDNQTDFIVFKINLLLRGVTDPMKRSEAINSIVKSISVIQNQIVRATYLKECSHRTGISEQTLINTMNGFIQNSREQATKEMRREMEREANTPIAAASVRKESERIVEQMIIQMVIRHGEELITVKNEDDEDVSLPLAQYVMIDLSADDLHFHNPLYDRVLQECVDHLKDENFKAETYFTHHPDIEINKLAIDMTIDRFQLSKSFAKQNIGYSTTTQILHLILDFRKDYVDEMLKQKENELKAASNDMEKMMGIMAELKDLQVIRNAIARKLGTDVIVHS